MQLTNNMKNNNIIFLLGSIILLCFNNKLNASNDSTFIKLGYIVYYVEENKNFECFNFYFLDDESLYEENKIIKTLKWEDVLKDKEKYLGKYIHLIVVESKIDNWIEMKKSMKDKNIKSFYLKGKFILYEQEMTIEDYTGTSFSSSHDFICLPIKSRYLYSNVYFLKSTILQE